MHRYLILAVGAASVEEIVLLNSAGERVELRVMVRAYRAIPRLVLGYVLKERLGQYVYGTNTHHTKQQLKEVMPGQLIQ